MRGILDPVRKTMVHRVHLLVSNLNILCLQEVKVIVFILNDTLDYICLGATMFQLA